MASPPSEAPTDPDPESGGGGDARGGGDAAAGEAEADTDRPLDDVLAAARPPESPALVLARARVAGALFGEGAGLGRFRVLERLGGGGMGVVYAAYDPQLDRGVALKTVRVPHGGRELALHEAKALARLSHPNVVPIFDVGIEAEHVYIVMELVRGQTLREWVKDREIGEILDVYRQAGQALVAAHGSNLVHRDVKPDNAIVGGDGRVRVVDFGLACELASEPGGGARRVVAGTPRYMAPEQAAGELVTAAADQYSFGVSLGEALAATGKPLARWIAAVIERATATDPAARFGSMQELLRALGRDPARVRRRRIAAAGLAVIAAAAFVVGRTSMAEDDVCGGGEREIAAVWPVEARAAQLVRIAGLSAYGALLAPQIERELADHAARWSANRRDACQAHRRGLQSAVLLDRRMACLERGRSSLAAVADIVTTADARALPEVALALRALPDPDGCADVAALAVDVDPPAPALAAPLARARAGIERARVHVAAGRFAAARALADDAIGAARALAYRPVLAEALLVGGHARMAMDAHDEADARLREATALGFACGAHAIAIEAWARRAWLEGTSGRPGNPLGGVDVVEALAGRTPSPFARALLHNNVGSIELARGRRGEARAAFARALGEARAVTGAGAVELVGVRSNMALVTDDPVRRDELLAGAHGELARLLGAGHPHTLFMQLARATTTVVPLREAGALLAETCAGQQLHAELAARAAACWVELADVRWELADRAGALAALDRAVALGADRSPDTPEVAGYRALWRGDPAAAIGELERVLAALAPRAGEPWYRIYARATAALGLGRALRAADRPRDALAQLEASAAALAAIARDHPAVAMERRLGRARAELAAVRAATGQPGAGEAAAQALAWLRPAGAPAAERAELERLAAGAVTAQPR